MHNFILSLLLISVLAGKAQVPNNQNLVIITIDGLRWQEVFGGADSSILFAGKYLTKDSVSTVKKYWTKSIAERREAVFPFLWNSIAKQGRIYGNRRLGNYMNTKNRYWFSYPGYNEIFTGYPDTLVNSNDYMANPNENVLAFLNKQENYKDRIVAFTNWNAFKRILNDQQSGILVNDGIEELPEYYLKDNYSLQMLNKLQFNLPALWDGDRMDGMTYQVAKEFMMAHHPKVTYISFGETDEWAHSGKYDFYLDAARYTDEMIKDLWTYLQTDKIYRGRTTLLITTDHGRGLGENWTSHSSKIPNSNEIWFAAIGPSIRPQGEIKVKQQLYQAQFAQTIAAILGYGFTTNHPVEEKIEDLFK